MLKTPLQLTIALAALLFMAQASADNIKVEKDKPASSGSGSSSGGSSSSSGGGSSSGGSSSSGSSSGSGGSSSSQGVSESSGTAHGFHSPTLDALQNSQTGQANGQGAPSSSHEYDGAPRR